MIIKKCLKCRKGFSIQNSVLKRKNRGKYCSMNCYRISSLGRKQTEEHIEKRIKHYIGEKHWNWKGNNVGYDALHDWVKRYLGQPTRCESCGQNDLIGKHINWANKSGKYLRDKSDWFRLCVPCHRKYDKISFYKGFIPWNKGTKGICKAWNKGLKNVKGQLSNIKS